MITQLWVRRHLRLSRPFIVIAFAPVLFWILATGRDIVGRKPDALEGPLVSLAVAWVVYFPVFALTGFLVLILRRLVIGRSALSVTAIGVIVGAGCSVLSLLLASAIYRLPIRVWPLSLVVGAVMGAALGGADHRGG